MLNPKSTLFKSITTTAFALLTSASAIGQAGDKRDASGQVQEEVWKEIEVPPAPVLTPEEAMKSFEIEAGYSLELVAAEPLVNDPVAMAWDEQGRLWVAEMWAYMPDVDATGENEPVSRVVVLEDLDNDGLMDRSTVFLDQLHLPRALAVTNGGILIADPPNLYFCQDRDGDLVCDDKRIVAPYAATGNVEHAENGLMRGIDNWYYNAKSDRRFKFEDGEITFETTHFRGQWGITQDDYGRIFYNTNGSYLLGDAIPWENVSAHPGHKPKAGMRLPVVDDQSVFTNRVNPGINRGYREGFLRPDFRLMKTTAASAPGIVRGDRYPQEMQGNALVPEPAGNVVSRFRLQDEGLAMKGEKILHNGSEWGDIEFISSTDERFRPVAAAMGPDGFMHIVDMYRGIIQHKIFLTTFLRKQIIERELDKPVGLGRIYRVVHESDTDTRSVTKLGDLKPIQLVNKLRSENGWVRDTAQRLLVESDSIPQQAIDRLVKFTTSGETYTRLHALWTLEGLDLINPDILTAAYDEGDAFVQSHVLRISEPILAKANGSQSKLWQTYLRAIESDSLRVRLQAIHLLRDANDFRFVQSAISSLPREDLDNPYVIDALISTLYQHETQLLALANLDEDQTRYQTLLTALVQAVFKANDSDTALEFAVQALHQSTAPPVLAAITQGFQNAMEAKNAAPLKIDQEPELFTYGPTPLAAAFTWEGKVDPNAVSAYEYTADDLESINRGKPLFQNYCAICHQSNGEGLASLAPELVGVDWVTGDKKRLALIVGHGLHGPIQVGDQTWNSAMPAHANHPSLQEEAFSDVLNYIRSAWGNNASPFQEGEARGYLNEYPDRNTPWTVKELEEELSKN